MLYEYTPEQDRGVIVSTLFQSLAWLTPVMIAERLRYTNLSFERITAALDEAVASKQAERFQAHPSGAILYRYRFPRGAE